MSEQPQKVKLRDEERSRIRWSSTKRGFVPRVEFYPAGTRRVRHVRPLRAEAQVVRAAGERVAREYATKEWWANRRRVAVRRVTLLEVDALGNVLGAEEVTR